MAHMLRSTPPRFFVDPSCISADSVVLTGDVLHHALTQRLRPNEIFHAVPETFYGEHPQSRPIEACVVRVLSVTKEELLGEIIERYQVVSPPYEIHLYPAVLKGEKFDLVVEKSVELGCASITPVLTARCIPRLDAEKKSTRILRWEKIARSAAEQSGRSAIPRINEVATFEDVVSKTLSGKPLIALERRHMCVSISKAVGASKQVSVLIGPEGGFEAHEIELALSKRFSPVSLGPYVLRAETASIAACAILMEIMSKDDMA